MITDTFDPQLSTGPTQGNVMQQYPNAGLKIAQPQAAILDARKKSRQPLYKTGPETRGGLPTPIRPAPLMRPKG